MEEEFENATLEEIEARLDPNFIPEGWLDPPTPPKKKLEISLNKKKPVSASELPAPKASRFAVLDKHTHTHFKVN